MNQPSDNQEEHSFAYRVASSVGWAFLSSWSRAIISLGAFALMARWIGPEGFGLHAMAVAFVMLAQVPVGCAIGECVVQASAPSHAAISRIFFLNLLVGLLLTILVYLLAPFVAGVYGEDLVANLLQVMAISMFVISLETIPEAILKRNLKYRPVTIATGGSTLIASVLGVILAWQGWGVWALTSMYLCQITCRCLIIVFSAKWRPCGGFLHANDASMNRYAAQSFSIQLSYELDRQLPRMIIGVLLGPVVLGFYALAKRVADIANEFLLNPVHGVALPSLSQARRENRSLRPLMEKAVQIAAAVGYPAVFGFSAACIVLIPLVFGDQWTPAVLTTQILVLIGVCATVDGFNGAVMRSVGKAHWELLLVISEVIAICLLVPIAALHSLEAVAGLLLLRAMIYWPISAWLVQKLDIMPMSQQFTLGYRFLICGLLMYVAVIAFLTVEISSYPVVNLVGAVLFGIVFYLGSCLLLARKQSQDVLQMAKSLAR